jgi:hypothetical protein
MGRGALQIARRLNDAGKVLFAEPNAIARIASTEPDDPSYVSQYRHYSYIGAQRADMQATGATPSGDAVIRVLCPLRIPAR